MERAVVGDVVLEYEESGAGEPVVCIHGAFLADAFRPLLSEPALSDRYRLVTYHRRGYAGSSRSGPATSMAEHAADCRRLLSHLGIGEAHVVGHSFGGAVGVQLALEAPEVVRTLSLVEAGLAIGVNGPLYRQALAQSIQRYRAVGAAVAVDEFLELRWPAYRAPLERALPGAFEQAVAYAPAAFEADLPAVRDFELEEAQARRIAQPVLVVLGEKSVALDPRFEDTYRLLLSWLPDAEGLVLRDATHLLHVEHPGALAKALAEFYARRGG